MEILKKVDKREMEQEMEKEAKMEYSACSDDCPKCRVSDG